MGASIKRHRHIIRERSVSGARVSLVLCLLCVAICAPTAAEGVDDCTNVRAPWAATYTHEMVGRDLAVGQDGAVLTVGFFACTIDFDPTDGVDERTSLGVGDIFATRINADGTYAWTYTAGGESNLSANGVAFDDSGAILITGHFAGTADFDPLGDGDVRVANGDFNGFIVKLGGDGSYVSTITFGEGTDRVLPKEVAVDPFGAIVVTGSFSGTADFDPGPGIDLHTATPLAQLAGLDIFITKMDGDGVYQWTRTIGAPGADIGREVGVDAVGNIYVAGTFRGTVDFDPGKGEDFHTVMGNIEDLFVTKLSPDGSYAWTRTFPVRIDSSSGTMAVDDDGTVYVTSNFEEIVDLDPTDGVDFRTPVGFNDIFATKLGADGSYGWTWSVGGTGRDSGHGVGVDDAGNVYVTGRFEETVDFDAGPGMDIHTSGENDDVFVTRLSADGSYGWTHQIGGSGTDTGQHVAVDGVGGVVILGWFLTVVMDFDPSCEVLQREIDFPGLVDTFVSKLTCFEPSADFNGDGAVDLLDVANYHNCFTGAQQENPVSCPTGCAIFDLDPDDAINLFDLPAIQAAMQGP